MQLIINTKGTHISKQNHLIEVRLPSGEKQRFLPENIDFMFISKGISVTSDVLFLALEKNIEIVFLNYSGEPQGRLWNQRFGSIAAIRKKQILFSQHPQGMEWVREQVIKKIQQQIAFAYQIRYSQDFPESKTMDNLIRKMIRLEQQVAKAGQNNAFQNSLRGWEGNTSKHYFELLSLAVPSMYHFAKRSRKPSEDIFNCLLNYMYGILYARVEGALMKAGIDPFIGIWHVDEYNKPVLSYDFIEPYRDWADRVAYRLCQQYSIHQEDLQTYKNGFWLAPSGKKKVVEAFQDYLEEIVMKNQKYRTRSTHLQLDANSFAQIILQFEP